MTPLNDLNIPRMGSVENAKFIEWRIAEGDSFAPGDILYEVETDKVTTEVEAVDAGILARRLSAPDDEHKVGDRVGLWAKPGTGAIAMAEALTAFDAGERAATPAATDATPARSLALTAAADAAAGGGEARLSPLVRKLAKEHGVDLATVTGTGPGGRITGEDVVAAAKPHGGATSGGRREPHSTRRKTIARRLTEAAAIPSLTADMQIDLSALLARRKADAAEGRQASVLAYVAVETARLLAGAHNVLNAHYAPEALVRFDAVHLGVAVDTPDGLVVPVIRDAERLDTVAMSAAIAALAEKARTNALSSADLDGGTFTLSNPGSLGPTIRAEALLNPPQVALLGLPGMVRVPVAVEADGDWTVAVRPVIRPSLTFDHRALDGGSVIGFLDDLRTALEAL